ncbi:hypothetical protein MKMG_02045 [Methanogenium sp. MK-MG]|nr:hypothetical protein MKMG_02045 [Methanogenium sp. MK-MG]
MYPFSYFNNQGKFLLLFSIETDSKHPCIILVGFSDPQREKTLGLRHHGMNIKPTHSL